MPDDGTLHLSVRKGRIIINPKKGPAVESLVRPSDGYNVTIPYANLRKSLKKKAGIESATRPGL